MILTGPFQLSPLSGSVTGACSVGERCSAGRGIQLSQGVRLTLPGRPLQRGERPSAARGGSAQGQLEAVLHWAPLL